MWVKISISSDGEGIDAETAWQNGDADPCGAGQGREAAGCGIIGASQVV
jgi:hypothetical protein